MIRLLPRKKRDLASEEVQERVRARIARELPELRIEIIAVLEDVLNDLADSPHPIEVKVFGEDQAQIEAVAHKVAARIKSIAGLADLYDGIEGSSPMRLIRVDHEAAGRAHITAQDVLDRVGAGLLGASGGTMPWFDRRLPIRVRYPDELRFTPERVL